MAEHTPGPWISYGLVIALKTPPANLPSKEHIVAGCPAYSDEHYPQAIANAQLMAAAPELMAALIHARNGLQQIGHEYGLLADMAEDMALIDAAIAKARGEARRAS